MTMTLRTIGRYVPAVLLCAALSLAACSDDDDTAQVRR